MSEFGTEIGETGKDPACTNSVGLGSAAPAAAVNPGGPNFP